METHQNFLHDITKELKILFSMEYCYSTSNQIQQELFIKYGEKFLLYLESNFQMLVEENPTNRILLFDLLLLIIESKKVGILKNKQKNFIGFTDEVLFIFECDFENLLKDEESIRFLKKNNLINLLTTYVSFKEVKLNQVGYHRKSMGFYENYDFNFVNYNLRSKLSFGKMKGLSVNEIISIKPDLIIFYLKNLKHFVIDFDVIVDSKIINYFKNRYLDFVYIAILKLQLSLELKLFNEETEAIEEEHEEEQKYLNRKMGEEGYNTFHEYFPDYNDDINYF